MPEFDPKLTSTETTDESEKKSRKPSRRKTREAASLGGLAANESLIWQRDKEAEPKPKKAAESIAEALRIADRKSEVSDEQAADDSAEPTEAEADHALTAGSPEADSGAEDEAKLAELTPDETHHVLDEYVQVRGMEVAAEQVAADPDSAEAAALVADADMLDRLRDKLEADPLAEPTAIAEAAYQEALDDLTEPPIPAEAEPLADQTETSPPVNEATPVPPTAGSGQPPRPPRSVMFANLPPDGTPFGRSEQPAVADQNVISVQEALHYERRAETRGLLVGGLVGYFIGRRRGRIKTEKRLLPVQEKLEQKVKDLHDIVADKEAQLRAEAAKRVAYAKEVAETHRLAERKAVEVSERPATAEQREKPPLFENLPAGPMLDVSSEVAARATKQTESAPDRAPWSVPETSSIGMKELAVERIKSLSTSELIAVSETVVIGGERLRDIYESKRITEPGLRNVMAEYARGGNVEKVLQQEIHNKELTFERDPRMRKRLAASLSAATGKAVTKAGKLSSDAKPKLSAQTDRAKTVGKKVVAQAVSTAKKIDNPANPMQQVLVRTWVAVMIILSCIALVLLFR